MKNNRAVLALILSLTLVLQSFVAVPVLALDGSGDQKLDGSSDRQLISYLADGSEDEEPAPTTDPEPTPEPTPTP